MNQQNNSRIYFAHHLLEFSETQIAIRGTGGVVLRDVLFDLLVGDGWVFLHENEDSMMADILPLCVRCVFQVPKILADAK